jgi:hypothetical protein
VDFKDLNKASHKDNFSLPRIDVLVNNVIHSTTYSFMDGLLRYKQIKMASEDKEKKNICHALGIILLQGYAI